jgi:SAM-dependent methyltransferase
MSSGSRSLEVPLAEAVERYRAGIYRDRIVHDLILADAARLGQGLTFLDIGCGKGFDTDVPLQQSLAASAGCYIGIEPDAAITLGDHIKDIHRCRFEDVDLAPGSVHVAFAIMVLEHLADPQPFWDKLHEVLAAGGVFLAMTVDARHWFCKASLWTERLKLKELYLSWLIGNRGSDRYENYPVYYRCNTPERVAHYARAFSYV